MTTKKIDWSTEERAALIKAMTHAKDVFYGLAVKAGHHQFLEFAGLMHEYIKLCTEAHEAGQDFYSLPMQEHHAEYIAEKLECIYGSAIKHSIDLTRAFLARFFDTSQPVCFKLPNGATYRWNTDHWTLIDREPSEQFPAIVRPGSL